MKSKAKWLTAIVTLAAVFVLVLSLGLSSVFAWADGDDEAPATNDGTAGRYYSDYATQDEAYAAVEDMNKELEEEGIVLLKNRDDSLPLSKGARVSVFGIAQDCLVETTGTITGSLKNAGFKVNETLEEFYLSDDASASSYGFETALGAQEKSSISLYDDVGVVVIARGSAGESLIESGKEGKGEVEDEKYLEQDQGWKHEAQYSETASGAEGGDVTTTYKHLLELTSSEQDLLTVAKQTCDKVVVLYSGSQVFEMANLENDENIDGILWIGRPGDGGIDAVGEVLCGDVNPSGKTVDEWTRDLTNDPAYANVDIDTAAFGYEQNSTLGTAGEDTGYYGLDYEEDIYLGYKFYETYWYEAKNNNMTSANPSEGADDWYDHNVVYPFGYGLSYTTFEYGDVTLEADVANSLTTNGSTVLSNVYNSTNQTGAKSLTATLDVTNTGDVAGKEVVEVYVQAPYDDTTATLEKPAWTLAGFAKTGEIKPGKTETVSVTFNLQDIASYDYVGKSGKATGYTLEQGTYSVHVMESSSHLNMESTTENCQTTYLNPAYSTTSFSVSSAIVMDLDDFSGSKIENLFSGSQETAESGQTASDEWKDEYDSMALADSSETALLSRANFDGTMPSARTSYVLSDEQIAAITSFDSLDADTFDDTGMPWEKTVADLDGWTQDSSETEYTLDDMAGVPLYNDDGSVNSAWTAFMNQLTWEEICTLVDSGQHKTAAVDSIGKVETMDENGPNYLNNGPAMTGTPTRSATWNETLLYRSGIVDADALLMQGVTGYYGPGVNIHRSPFEGRNTEYFSQDAIQGGYMAAALCRGMEDRGINVYVKHFAMYDSIAGVNSSAVCVTASEQNMRENYLRAFQICMQEGGASAAMTSFNRIGAIYAGQNYALLQALARDEWGWTGYFVTDLYSGADHMTVDGLVRAGANIPNGTYLADGDFAAKSASGTWDGSYEWTEETAEISNDDFVAPQGAVIVGSGSDSYASATQWYCARVAAMQILYNQCNSAGNNNGVTGDKMSYSATVDMTQAEMFAGEYVVDESLADRMTGYEITDGVLPDGLSISEGRITGTPTVAGDFAVTLTAYVDRWITVTSTLNISVAASVTMEFDVSSIETGSSVDVYVMPDRTMEVFGATASITYEIADGSLPLGLELDGDTGRITGTPAVAGTYTFTIAVVAADPTRWVLDWSNLSVQSNYNIALVLSGMTWDSDTDFVNWVRNGGTLNLNGVTMYADLYFREGIEYWAADPETYYLTYTITVSDGGSTGGVSSDELEAAVSEAVDAAMTESSSGNGMAITGLVLGIVAIVLAAAVLVIVLLRRNNGGSSSGDKGSSD